MNFLHLSLDMIVKQGIINLSSYNSKNYTSVVVSDSKKWTRRHEFKSWTDCISQSTNTLGKGMNPIILPPAMGK